MVHPANEYLPCRKELSGPDALKGLENTAQGQRERHPGKSDRIKHILTPKELHMLSVRVTIIFLPKG